MIQLLKKVKVVFDPNQRLNVMYFVSESKMRSFSVSVPMLAGISSVFTVLVTWGLISFFMFGSNSDEISKLKREQKFLQAQVFQFQNQDNAIYKETYAEDNPASRPLTIAANQPKVQTALITPKPTLVESKSKVEKKIEEKVIDSKNTGTGKGESLAPETKLETIATKETAKLKEGLTPKIPENTFIGYVETPKLTPTNTVKLDKLIPSNFNVVEINSSKFAAKLEGTNLKMAGATLTAKVKIKSIGKEFAGGGVRAKLYYKKIGSKELSSIEVPSKANATSGKYMFLAKAEGTTKDLVFDLPGAQVQGLERLEISLLSNNCLLSVDNCQREIDINQYEIDLKTNDTTKPLATGKSEHEAG